MQSAHQLAWILEEEVTVIFNGSFAVPPLKSVLSPSKQRIWLTRHAELRPQTPWDEFANPPHCRKLVPAGRVKFPSLPGGGAKLLVEAVFRPISSSTRCLIFPMIVAVIGK